MKPYRLLWILMLLPLQLVLADDVSLQLESTTGWVHNLLRLSSNNLERFAEDPDFQKQMNSASGLLQDVIGSARYSRRLPGRWRVTGSLSGKLSSYPQNLINNYSLFTGWAELKRLSRWSVRLYYARLNDFYLRDYRDLLSGDQTAARFDGNHWILTLRTLRLPGNPQLYIGLNEEFYNRTFRHFDIRTTYLGVELSLPRCQEVRTRARVYYHYRNNIGYDPTLSFGGLDSETGNATAREWEFRLLLDRGLNLPLFQRVDLTWRIRLRQYLTGQSVADDPVHAGRSDNRQRLTLSLNSHRFYGVTASPSVDYEWRRVQADDPELSRYRNFQQFTILLKLHYSFKF